MTTQKEFFNQIKQGAIKGWKTHKVLPSISLAQAALESAWGKSELATKGNNLFGIKGNYNGDSITIKTSEFINGEWVKVDAKFKKYPSWNESIEDHGTFFTSSEWRKTNYKAVIGETDYKKTAKALQSSGYATDPTYADKLIKLIEEYKLNQWDNLKGDIKDMSLTIKKQLAPTRPMVNGYGYGNKKKFLTIHQTGNTTKGANAQMHANLQSRVYGASWHWQVDDKEAIQSFEHTYQCWHASDGRGDGNSNSIGIEGCINSDGNYVQSVKNMADLAAKILKDEGIPIENMRQHHDFDTKNRKNCPAQIRAGKDGINWNKFVQMVKDNMKGAVVKEPVKTPVAKPAVKPTPKPVVTKPQPTGNVVVRSIQKTVGVAEDGWDGPNTRKGVVKLFQRYFGANADGYVGNETLNKSKVIRSGDKGWHVYAVQSMLYLKGYTSVGTPDQKFGPASVQATKNFQKDNSLGVDGTPGKQTFAKLLKL